MTLCNKGKLVFEISIQKHVQGSSKRFWHPSPQKESHVRDIKTFCIEMCLVISNDFAFWSTMLAQPSLIDSFLCHQLIHSSTRQTDKIRLSDSWRSNQ